MRFEVKRWIYEQRFPRFRAGERVRPVAGAAHGPPPGVYGVAEFREPVGFADAAEVRVEGRPEWYPAFALEPDGADDGDGVIEGRGGRPMARLKQLPNGTWVDPDYIMAVQVLDYTDLTGGGYAAPRVVIHLRDGDRWLIECADHEKACAMRDAIARLSGSEAIDAAMAKTDEGGEG